MFYQPRPTKIFTNKGFVNNDNGSVGETHSIAFEKTIKNHFTLIQLVDIVLNFLFNNNQNQSILIGLGFKNFVKKSVVRFFTSLFT